MNYKNEKLFNLKDLKFTVPQFSTVTIENSCVLETYGKKFFNFDDFGDFGNQMSCFQF